MSRAPMYTTHGRPSSAATVAVATPCWPAPVSAIRRGLAQPLGKQALAKDVVDLVRAGMREVLALQVKRGYRGLSACGETIGAI